MLHIGRGTELFCTVFSTGTFHLLFFKFCSIQSVLSILKQLCDWSILVFHTELYRTNQIRLDISVVPETGKDRYIIYLILWKNNVSFVIKHVFRLKTTTFLLSVRTKFCANCFNLFSIVNYLHCLLLSLLVKASILFGSRASVSTFSCAKVPVRYIRPQVFLASILNIFY